VKEYLVSVNKGRWTFWLNDREFKQRKSFFDPRRFEELAEDIELTGKTYLNGKWLYLINEERSPIC